MQKPIFTTAAAAIALAAVAASPAQARFLQTDPIGYEDQVNLYAYVGNDPINGVDPTGQRCESADGITTCTPENTDFEAFSFPTPEGWEDFDASDSSFHDYQFDFGAGQGSERYGGDLGYELNQKPSPGPNPATRDGTINDVNIAGPFGRDDVTSYAKFDSDGNSFVVNVTEANHAVGSGFVVRRVVSDGNGGFTIQTYGEGNSWKQAGVFESFANGQARQVWRQNANTIIRRARGRAYRGAGIR